MYLVASTTPLDPTAASAYRSTMTRPGVVRRTPMPTSVKVSGICRQTATSAEKNRRVVGLTFFLRALFAINGDSIEEQLFHICTHG